MPVFLGGRSPTYGHWRHRVQTVALALIVAGAQLSQADARHLRLIALGDSLTAGLGLRRDQTFPDRLQAALRARGWDVDVVNAGVSGDTARDGLARYDWAVPPDADALIVEFGANDMLRGLAPAATKKALSAILDKARAAHLAVLIAGMRAAPNLGPDYARDFDSIYSTLAKAYDSELYPFFLDGVAADLKLNQKDGLHPNAAGVDVLVDRMLPSVEILLRRVNP